MSQSRCRSIREELVDPLSFRKQLPSDESMFKLYDLSIGGVGIVLIRIREVHDATSEP